MKSVIITFFLFGLVMLAINYHVFDILSSSYVYGITTVLLIVVIAAAFKVLGNPFRNKDERHDKE